MENMDGHVYQTFDGCSNQRKFNKMTEMFGQYISKKINLSVDLMPVYNHIEEPTVPRPGEVMDANDALNVAVYAQPIKQYCDRTHVLKENRRELHSVIWEQCSETMGEKIRQEEDFKTKDDACDVIWLLKTIRGIMFSSRG